MIRDYDQAFQDQFRRFNDLCDRAEALGTPLSNVHPDRFDEIEAYEELNIDGSTARLAAVRVAFHLKGGDGAAFYRLEAHFLTGRLAFTAFAADRQLMDRMGGDITFHAIYESRGDEHQSLRTGAQLIQLAVAGLHLERSGRLACAQAIHRLLKTGRGEMPGYPGAPEFDMMSDFRL